LKGDAAEPSAEDLPPSLVASPPHVAVTCYKCSYGFALYTERRPHPALIPLNPRAPPA
jgi:hypothetical protein